MSRYVTKLILWAISMTFIRRMHTLNRSYKRAMSNINLMFSLVWNRLRPSSCPNPRRVCIKRNSYQGAFNTTNVMPRQVGVRLASLFLYVTSHRCVVAFCRIIHNPVNKYVSLVLRRSFIRITIKFIYVLKLGLVLNHHVL